MKKRILVALVSLLVSLPVCAFGGQYYTGKLGLHFPEEGGFDTGPNLEFAYGLDLADLAPTLVQQQPALRNVTAEAGIGYYTSDYSRRTSVGRVEAEYDVIPLTLTALYHIPLQQTPFSLYAGGGVGLYLNFWEWEGTTYPDDENLDLGLHFTAGAALPLNPQLELLGELKVNFITEDIGGAFLNVGAKYRF